MSQEILIGIKEASHLLGCGMSTLRHWDNIGKLKALRTLGGFRKYKLSDIQLLQGIETKQDSNVLDTTAIYARVSSNEQKTKGDLERQKTRLLEYCVKKKYKVEYIFDEVGSGMNDNRIKFNRLFDIAKNKKINRIVIEHKDRLTRFNFNLCKTFFNSFNVDIDCVEEELPKTYESEIVEDIISLLSSFSARLYGKRSAKNRKSNKNKIC